MTTKTDSNDEWRHLASNPMTEREERIMYANNRLNGNACPDCGRTVEVCDLTRENELYIVHEDDPEPSTQTRGHDAGRCTISPDKIDLE
jgi:hypothetical protein